jgi:hypothetical protein
MSTVDYTFQQMEHGSSQTQEYSLWSAKLATHMLQPAQMTEVFTMDKLELVCLMVYMSSLSQYVL